MQPLNNSDPRVLGTFEILAQLGAGGMGRAYLARRLFLEGLGREWETVYRLSEPDSETVAGADLVVVKVILPELLEHPDPVKEAEVRARFVTETDAVRAVISPRVPALVGADPDGQQPWLAMDFVRGPSLSAMISYGAPLAVGPYAALGLALVEALRAIHGAGLYHRDLKPGNVVLGPDGPVVLDFGLAVLAERRVSQALTAAYGGMGTYPYMPLEQLKSTRDVDHTADIYALGASLFYAVTGRPPYHVVPLAEPPSWHGVDDLYRPLLEQIIVQDPAQRPSLDEVEKGLEALLADQGLTPELAARELWDAVESSGLVPVLPAAALDDHGDPGVQEAAQRAVDRGSAPDAPWAADGETDLFDVFFGEEPGDEPGVDPEEERPGATQPHDRPVTVPPVGPAPQDATHPPTVVDRDAPPAAPAESPHGSGASPVPVTSYRLPLPVPVAHRTPRGALRVVKQLREDYAHSGRL
ncbi:serine/threonine-protein kinase [Streptomyces sp. NPDC091267]|uniref:serine/threonine-protein kinase n=1 Tax=Streptomyces sp. NPDC091267 TaxID=3155195 RepID=UPI00342000C3